MNFDPSNYFLKIWNSIGIPTPKVGIHLGMCGLILSHYLTHSTHTFPCPCLGCEPKAKVMIVVLGENDDHGGLHQESMPNQSPYSKTL